MRYILILVTLYCSLFGFGSFLMPEDAFKPSAEVKENKLIVRIELADSIYLYKDKLNISLKDGGIVLKNINYPQSEDHDGQDVFTKSVTIDATLVKNSNADEIIAVVAYQGCSEKGLCYEPLQKEFKLQIDASKLEFISTNDSMDTVVVSSETDTITNTFKSGSISLILLTFFGFGLLLALTPCVFPMIPILSSIIVSQGEGMTAKKGFILSLIYVLAMSIAYTMAGVLAGLFGSNIQAAMQNPWVLSIFASIFVALAISMFGFFEIGLPSSLQSKLSNTSHKAGHKGGFLGVAIMGFLSALIVGPCVAPPLAGALMYIGQTGDALLGGVALFVMSLGMGVPLLLIGIGAGKFMPRPGGWMTSVSKVFGVIMLAIAIWLLSRVLSNQIIMFLWSLLLIVSSVYLGVFEALKDDKRAWNALMKGLGIFIFIIGASLLLGALSGAANPLNPYENFTSKRAIANDIQNVNENKFIKIHSIDELDSILKNSKGKKVMLDFYADWCTSCKELEHNTFSHSDVQKMLKSYVLVQADVTANSKSEKELSKKFGVFGPPSILFFDENGNNLTAKKLIGYKPPEEFLKHLSTLL
ncbi:protein-disulfide reductase DsbD [bacterium]|nr:protein-disulfide reductase DsbD [bacterium]